MCFTQLMYIKQLISFYFICSYIKYVSMFTECQLEIDFLVHKYIYNILLHLD